MKRIKVYTVTDLGPGDGGKGGVVEKLCSYARPALVIKDGGCQGSHGVRKSDERSFNFKHFCCGTLDGFSTHLSHRFILEPYTLISEARDLASLMGCNIATIFAFMTIDKDALVVTPFHTLASQLQELARKENAKGTVGMGAGLCRLDALAYPDDAIYARDLYSENLQLKLKAVRERMVALVQEIMDDLPNRVWQNDLEEAKEIVKYLKNTEMVRKTTDCFYYLAQNVSIVGKAYANLALSRGNVVIESSHGVLTDCDFGFLPYVSRTRTTLQHTLEMLDDYGYSGRIVNLAVSRAYQIRHGAGPMPTADESMLPSLLPGSHKENNRWQGNIRVGALDLTMMRYAINVCGGADKFDGLCITWADQILKNGAWKVSSRYEIGEGYSEFFDEFGDLRVSKAPDHDYQRQMSKYLFDCVPNVESFKVEDNKDKFFSLISTKLMRENVNIPIKMMSYGATARDRMLV